MNRPLLVVDGDSFAHRSYHALPKSIRRRGDKGAGAIVGFANFLLRLYGSIATMDPTAPLPALPDQTPTWGAAAALAREWELNRLADRLKDLETAGD